LVVFAASATVPIAACQSDLPAADDEKPDVVVPDRSTTETPAEDEDEDTTLPDTPPELLPDAAPVEEDPDGGADAAIDAGACVDQPDGFQPDGATATQRCCGERLVRVNTATNCGACGIICPQGKTCGQVRVGKWGCHCSTNASCATAGYGAGSTCFTNGAGSYCNCQCPNGATTCKDVCKGGATCYDISGQNYCSY
jgi:hypothetical protein